MRRPNIAPPEPLPKLVTFVLTIGDLRHCNRVASLIDNQDATTAALSPDFLSMLSGYKTTGRRTTGSALRSNSLRHPLVRSDRSDQTAAHLAALA